MHSKTEAYNPQLYYYNWYAYSKSSLNTHKSQCLRKNINHINGNLYHYAGNNPVRYIDPDGREDFLNFDYKQYVQGYAKGYFNGIAAGFQNALGEIKNFASNLLSGKGTLESYYSVSLTIGNGSYDATMYVSNSEINFEFSEPSSILTDALQNAINLPITIESDGVKGDIPLGTYYGASLSIPVSASKKDGSVAILTLGMKGSMKSIVTDSLSVTGETGYRITASVQDGPSGTIRNRKNASLNRKVDNYKYYTSEKFIMENIY